MSDEETPRTVEAVGRAHGQGSAQGVGEALRPFVRTDLMAHIIASIGIAMSNTNGAVHALVEGDKLGAIGLLAESNDSLELLLRELEEMANGQR